MDQDPINPTLADRLERLERECTELKRQAPHWRPAWGMTLGGMDAVLGGGGGKVDDGILKVRGLIMEDERGKVGMAVRVSDGGSMLSFTGNNGLPRFIMGLGGGRDPSDKPFLNMRDETAKPRVLM